MSLSNRPGVQLSLREHVCAEALPAAAKRPPRANAQTLDRAIWDPTSAPSLSGISSLVAVHRLREVACLYGFTRFEPAPLANEDLEDVGLAVNGAALGQNPEWLPAVEQYGEGFFIRFSSEALAQWLVRPAICARSHWRGVRR